MHTGSSLITPLESHLVQCLLSPDAYPHPVESIKLIETHISWVFLTGPFAYKIKKPVDLGFLDFRELSSRLFYCEEEIRLNQRWAPEIYLDVVPISVQSGQPLVGGDGPVVDYAVRMRQFDQRNRLDAQLNEDKLSEGDMDELADIIALRHGATNIIGPKGRNETLSNIRGAMWDNLDALEGQSSDKILKKLRFWTGKQLDRLDSVLQRRFNNGFVRECHGDLHLTNLVRLPTGITAFDCLEFSADLRNTDVMADIAFLVMDLISRQRFDLAYQFLNRYLEVTGDYDGMEVFTLYFVYRCLVRAKIAVIRSQEQQHDTYTRSYLSRVRQYCNMALKQTQDRTPNLIVMHGLSGSGKTWLSTRIMSTLPALRIRSDIERKRMFDLNANADSGSRVAQGIYSEEANKALYLRIHDLGATLLRAGHDVILDAAYLKFSKREHARQIAANCKAEFVIVHAHAPENILRARIRQRADSDTEPSEADLAVLEYQLENIEPLTPAEQRAAVSWNSCESIDADKLGIRLRHSAQRPVAV